MQMALKVLVNKELQETGTLDQNTLDLMQQVPLPDAQDYNLCLQCGQGGGKHQSCVQHWFKIAHCCKEYIIS